MNPPGSGVLRCVFRCEAELQRTDDTLMRLWRHFRKFGYGFRVGGDFNRASSNQRSSLVTDRRPERRAAFWWPNLWSSISGQLPVTHEVTGRGRGAAAVWAGFISVFGASSLTDTVVPSSRLVMEWRQQSSVSCAHAFIEAQRWIEVRISLGKTFPVW